MDTLSGGTIEASEAPDGNLWILVVGFDGRLAQVKVTDQEAAQLRDSLTALLRRRRARRASRRRSGRS